MLCLPLFYPLFCCSQRDFPDMQIASCHPLNESAQWGLLGWSSSSLTRLMVPSGHRAPGLTTPALSWDHSHSLWLPPTLCSRQLGHGGGGGGGSVPGRHWAPPPGGPLHMLYPLLGTMPACTPPFSLAVSPSHFQVSLKPHLSQETFPRIGCRTVHSLHGTVVGPTLPSPPFFTLAIKPTLSSLEAGIVRCVSSYLQILVLAGTRREPSKSLWSKLMEGREKAGERQSASGAEVVGARAGQNRSRCTAPARRGTSTRVPATGCEAPPASSRRCPSVHGDTSTVTPRGVQRAVQQPRTPR